MSAIIEKALWLADLPRILCGEELGKNERLLLSAAVVGSEKAHAYIKIKQLPLNEELLTLSNLWKNLNAYIRINLQLLDKLHHKVSGKTTAKSSKKALALLDKIESAFTLKKLILVTVVDYKRALKKIDLSEFPSELQILYEKIQHRPKGFEQYLSRHLLSEKNSLEDNVLSNYLKCTDANDANFHAVELTLQADDYTNIQALDIIHKARLNADRKYIIYVPEAGKHAVDQIQYIYNLAILTKCNILVINTRNHSLTNINLARNCQDFMLDAMAGLNFLLSCGIEQRYITFYSKNLHNFWLVPLVEELDQAKYAVSIFYKRKKYKVLERFVLWLFFGITDPKKIYDKLPENVKAFTLIDLRNLLPAIEELLSQDEIEGWQEHGLGLGGGGVRLGTKHFKKAAKLRKAKAAIAKAMEKMQAKKVSGMKKK